MTQRYPKPAKAIAWSLDPDPQLEADARAWAQSRKVRLVACVIERPSLVECAQKGSPLWHTRLIVQHLDKTGLGFILCRGGQLAHPGIPFLADTVRREGIVIVDPLAEQEPPREVAKEPKRPTLPLARRMLLGRQSGARSGRHQAGPAPYGYRRARAEGRAILEPDSEEAEVVRTIFREYLRHRSMEKLVEMLDAQGLRTRRKNRWSRAGVSWILKNETYLGRVHFGPIRAQGLHPPLIAPIVFNKVQKLIRENKKRGRDD